MTGPLMVHDFGGSPAVPPPADDSARRLLSIRIARYRMPHQPRQTNRRRCDPFVRQPIKGTSQLLAGMAAISPNEDQQWP